MTKRVLVVDVGYFGNKSDFQYMVVDFDDDMKIISHYNYDEGAFHNSTLALAIEALFYRYKCDEIYMDTMGLSMCIYENLSDELKNVVLKDRITQYTISEKIHMLIGDLHTRKIFIDRDSIKLYDAIKAIGNEKSIYCNDVGILKLGKDLKHEDRRKLHMMLGMYIIN